MGGYRDHEGAALARAEVALDRWDSTEATLRAMAAQAGQSRAQRERPQVDAAMSSTELLTTAERIEREVSELERELARARLDSRARGAVSSPPPPDRSSAVREALARHATVGSRIRRIAPLIVAARAGRELAFVDPSSLLERRPSLRGSDDPQIAEDIARRLRVQCNAAENELARIGLASATGESSERTREIQLARALIEEARYERRARLVRAAGRSVIIGTDLTGAETEDELRGRAARIAELRAALPPVDDALDTMLGALAEEWERYGRSVAAVPRETRALLAPLPEIASLSSDHGIATSIAAVRRAIHDAGRTLEEHEARVRDRLAAPPVALPAPPRPADRSLAKPLGGVIIGLGAYLAQPMAGSVLLDPLAAAVLMTAFAALGFFIRDLQVHLRLQAAAPARVADDVRVAADEPEDEVDASVEIGRRKYTE